MQASQTFHIPQPDKGSRAKTRVAPTYYTMMAHGIFALLFALTVLLGVWVAYDHWIALSRLVQMIMGFALLLGIPFFSQEHTRLRLSLLGVGCSWLAGVMGILVGFLGEYRSGALAGGISLLLPLASAATYFYWLHRRQQFVYVFAPLIIALLGLVISFEHSAWLSTLVGLFCSITFFYLSEKEYYRPANWVCGFFVVLFALLLFGAFWLLTHAPGFVAFLAGLPMGDSVVSRLDLWQNTLTLIHDYPFTGSGMGVSAMVYSTYIYLLHTPYFYHAHELFLQIAVEQGLPGLIAFVGMLMTAFYGLLATHAWRESTTLRLLYSATLGSLVTLIVYGLQDAEIYVQPTAPLLFVPFGFALALQWRVLRKATPNGGSNVKWDSWLPIGTPYLILLGLMLWPGALAAMQADLGAVTQTKAELSAYHWPESKLQDNLRYRHEVNLKPALAYYHAALAANPNNDTAYRRLGQVALSEGDVANAEKYLARALALNAEDRAARQLLGEVYAISGKIDEAVALWRTIDLSGSQLDVRAWWYEHIGARREAQLLTKALEQLKAEQVTGE